MRRLVVAALVAVGCAHQPAPAPAPVAEAAPPPPRAEAPDEMQVTGTLGTLDDEEIAAPFQRRWNDITRCYDQAAERLNYLGGRIELKLRVGPTGEPTKVYVASSTLGNYDAERCVLEIARTLRFAHPHGGAEAELTYPIEFRGRRAVQTWDEARVSPSVARHRRDVAACKARAQNGLPPTLTMTVYVAPGGKVTSAGLAADAPLDDAFAQCLVQRSRAWRLDDPLGKIAKATVAVAE